MKTALLIIDVQQALTDARPAQADSFLLNLSLLAETARNAGKEAVYVRHDGGEGDELQRGLPGWEITREIAPQDGERVFDKRFNSAFRDTALQAYLQTQGIRRLVVCGMQTEYCIDTSVKVAFELGYDLVIPSGAVTTFDNPFLTGAKLNQYYERMIWNGSFARVLPMEEALAVLRD